MYFFIESGFSLIYVLEIWMLGTPDPGDCERFPLNTDLRYAQVP